MYMGGRKDLVVPVVEVVSMTIMGLLTVVPAMGLVRRPIVDQRL
jgi:hypothetical protein